MRELSVERIREAERAIARYQLRCRPHSLAALLGHRGFARRVMRQRRVVDDEALARQVVIADRTAAMQQRRMPEQDLAAPGEKEFRFQPAAFALLVMKSHRGARFLIAHPP